MATTSHDTSAEIAPVVVISVAFLCVTNGRRTVIPVSGARRLSIGAVIGIVSG